MSEPPIPAPLPDIAQAAAQANAIRDQVQRAILGQEELVDQVLCAFMVGGHVLIEGVPGLGKTLLVLALSRTIGGRFSRVQFTPDLMPSDVTGHSLFNQSTGEWQVRKGPAFTNLLLADEINRAPAKTQAALLEVMQEQQVSIEGQTFSLEPPFMTLATQNPIEQEGTYPLPEAQLDRFLLKVVTDYPDEDDELAVVRMVTTGRIGDTLNVSQVQQIIDPAGARALQQRVATVLVDDRIMGYAVRLVRTTRSWQGLSIGAGTRGAISLVRAARGFAVLEERDFVIPDDVKRAALPALRHRVRVAPELEIEGLSVDQVLSSIVDAVEAPRQ
ncbi:MAG: MoxR family ATPase [Alphaproteobacteria bacterium]|nr:MoxR family ATPase [Alphaproteobacteria bacterium]